MTPSALIMMLTLAVSAGEDAGTQDLVFLAPQRPVLIRLHIINNRQPLRAGWESFIQSLYEQLDTDKDGKVTVAEARRALPPALLSASGNIINVQAGPVGPQLQGDKDGNVTREELARYYRQNGAPPFQLIQGGQQSALNRVQILGQATPVSGEALTNKLFELADTNKDGRLTADELAALPEQLMRFDFSDDEVVSADELLPAGGNPYTQVVPARGLAPVPSTPPVLLAVTPEAMPAVRNTLLRVYHMLVEEKVNELFSNPPAVELQLRVGAKDAGSPVVEILKVETPKGLTEFKIQVTGGTIFLDTEATRVAFKVGGSGGVNAVFNIATVYSMQFTNADKDNNGYLDKMEADGSIFRGLFTFMDLDGDGLLYEKEMKTFLASMEKIQEKARTAGVYLSINDQGKGLFDMLDTNRDGHLSIRELRAAVKLATVLDRNGDGAVAVAEIPRTYEAAAESGFPSTGQFAARVVVAGGRMTPATPAVTASAGPLWFRKMDRNKDGDVSRREFLGTDEEFRTLDKNGDGLISAEEAQAQVLHEVKFPALPDRDAVAIGVAGGTP